VRFSGEQRPVLTFLQPDMVATKREGRTVKTTTLDVNGGTTRFVTPPSPAESGTRNSASADINRGGEGSGAFRDVVSKHREVWSSPPGGRRRGGPVETRLPLTLPRVFPTRPLGGDPAVSPQSPPEGKNVST
jgi:hypothetical protein